MGGVKFDIGGNANGFINATRQAEAAAGRMTKNVTNEGKALDDMFKKLAGTMATVGAGLSASALTKEIFNIRSEFQQLEIAFGTMLKSKEKANQLMKDAAEFAATTPFDLKGVAAGIKQNLAYGASVDTVIDEMRMLGDVAAGVSMPLNDLVYLYGTLRTSGRVATIDIRQFAGRGIPIYEELAKVLGVAKNEVAGLVTAGKVGFADVEKAFKNMTSAGGMFNNLMADQSKSLGGQYSNLKDNIEMMFNEIGKSQEGVFSDAMGLASNLVENYKEVGRILGVVVATYGTYKAAILAVAAAQKVQATAQAIQTFVQLTRTLKVATAAQQAFNSAAILNPYALAAAAVIGLIVGVNALVGAKTKEERIHDRVNDQLERYNENLSKQKAEMQKLFDVLNSSESTDMQRVFAMEQLRELYPSILKDLSDEELMKLSVAEATRKLTEENELLLRQDLASKIVDMSKKYEDAMAKINAFRNASDDAVVKSYQKNSSYIQAQKDAENYRIELEALIKTFNSMEDAARQADFLALPADQKIISLEESNRKLDEEIADLDKKLKDLKGKRDSLNTDTSVEFKLGDLSGALYDGGLTEAELLAEIEKRQSQKKENEQDIAKSQAQLDEQNKKETEKQKEERYKRQQAEIKAADNLAKMVKQLNDKVAKADIDSMEEGYAKSLKTLKFNLKQETDAIEEQKKALLKSKKDEALKSWLAEDPEGRKEYQFVYSPKLTPEEEKIFADMGVQAQREFNKGREKIEKQFGKEAEFTTRQFEIDAMETGSGRDAAQRRLDNERELHELEMQREAYIEAAKAAHILAEQKKAASDPTYMMKMFDDSQANADFDKIVKRTEEKQDSEEQNRINELIIQYGDYEDKKAAIQVKYLKMRAGITGTELEIINRQEQKALYDLEQQYSKTASAIQDLFGNTRKKSASELNAIADSGEKALEYIKLGVWSEDNPFGLSEEAFNQIGADPSKLLDIANAIEQIRKQADALEDPLKNIAEGFKELFGSAAGTQEFEDALSKISSGVNDITNAFSFVSDSIGSMGEALGNSGMQKASEGINSALSVVGSTMSGAQAGAAFGPWGAAAGAAIGLVTSFVTEVSKAKDAIKQARIDELAAKNEELEKSYDNLEKSIKNAYSVDASKMIEQQNQLLEQKKANLRLMIAEEEAKKNSNEEQINAWKEQIDSIESSIESNAEKAKEAIVGISFDGFRDNFLSALLDMEEGVEGLSKTIEEDIRKAMYDALLSDDAFESQIKGLYDDLAAAIEAGDTREIDRIKKAILNLYDRQEEKAREIDEKLGYEADSTRSASEKGIAQASQSSVDELNGRMTAIQSHTFSINERVGSLVSITEQILGRVSSIDGKASRLEDIDKSLAMIWSAISDIVTRGIKIKS